MKLANRHERFEAKSINHQASTARVLTGLRSFSAACAAPKPASTVTLQAYISCAMHKKAHWGKIAGP